MSTIRYFSGAREPGKQSIAGSLVRLEFQKKGKFTTSQRYSYIFKKRMEEKRAKAVKKLGGGFKLPGSIQDAYKASKTAEKALKDIAARKAHKEAKKERKMVIIQPRNFNNGKLARDGKLFDVAGNVVARVNPKNGKIVTSTGWALGKYKPKSFMTDRALQEAIDKFSPHFIALRKQQMLAAAGQQQYGVHGPSIVHSPSEDSSWGSGSGGTDIWGNSGGNIWGTGGSIWGESISDFAGRVASFFGLK